MPLEPLNNEKELLILISQGDESAFEKLFLLYYPQIEPVILKLTRTESVINDIIQEVFIKLWLSRDKLTEIEVPASWIFRIVYNCTYTWMRQNLSRERTTSQINEERIDTTNPLETEEIVSFKATSKVLNQAVQNLPPKSKRIYLMRESGLKNPEIAKKLGISQNTVKSTLTRSVQEIRKHLSAHGIELPLILLTWFL